MTVELVCPFCHFSKRISEKRIPASAKWAICPNCRQKFEITLPENEPVSTSGGVLPEQETSGTGQESGTSSARTGAPWEHRSGKGFFWSFYQTFKAAVFSPASFFKELNFKGGFKEPLAFGLLAGAVGNMFGLFWPVMMLSGGLLPFETAFFGQLGGGLIFFTLVVVIPVCVLAGMFVYTAILHLLLLIVRGGTHGFEATFRVVAYSQAAQLWQLAPVIGSWIAGTWQIVVQIIGLREIHGVSYLRVVIAFLLPIFFLSALAAAVAIPMLILFLK